MSSVDGGRGGRTYGVNFRRRASGILLHPTCLPGPHASGDIGAGARQFVDFLAAAGQSWWQMLPVGPPGYGASPYSAESAFAGHPLLIDIDALESQGLVDPAFALPRECATAERVDFGATESYRMAALRAAFASFSRSTAHRSRFLSFCNENTRWLEDFALFRALKREYLGVQWTRWESGIRDRDPSAMAAARTRLAGEIEFEKFIQYVFDEQWRALRAYAETKGIGLIGDLPIFVAHDSADVWQNVRAFLLDPNGEPTFVAGVPPDYFSAKGQRWGNPLYRWGRMAKTGYAWWIERMRMMLKRFHAVRLDHFIGYHRYWKIPAGEPTAMHGRWVKGPGVALFDAATAMLGQLPLVAEDLGVATPGVYALRDRYRWPGIKILQFAFGTDPAAPTFLPHNYGRRAVVYTGTHDNDTVVGWFHGHDVGTSTRTEAQVREERAAALRYLGTTGQEVHWDMIRVAFASVARLAIIPLQDVLGLGSEARMNRPGLPEGNWSYRVSGDALTAAIADRLAALAQTYGRAPRERRS